MNSKVLKDQPKINDLSAINFEDDTQEVVDEWTRVDNNCLKRNSVGLNTGMIKDNEEAIYEMTD